MLLAGDVGGTKTFVGLFARGADRPAEIESRSYRTNDFESLDILCRQFLSDTKTDARKIESACVGVAGPVKDRRARLTNVPWNVDADALASALSFPVAGLLNDLEAMAWSIPVLRADEIAVLQEGSPSSSGGAALIAAGTGLGIALLPRIEGKLVPQPSEGGHADFAARTADEIRLQEALTREFGRAQLEQVLSGPGLVTIFRHVYPHECATLKVAPVGSDVFPSLISSAALDDACPTCRKVLELFVSVYGASAGNIALIAMATSGVYLGGGIAPRILPALRWPVFEEAFCAKAPLGDLMRRVPVRVILNQAAGLLGAAVYAARHSSGG
jgi:glucokinase